ncbi:MAG: Trk system potassium transporter TrkA [Clostridia bacterium]|nr:Trk system potassium transporter TrkA [Clostridia bacterium]
MKIIIVGVGNVGSELIRQLSREGHDIIVVDTNERVVEDMVNNFDVKGILGNGISNEIMSEAEVSSADLLIACTQYDELNMLCCLVGKKLGAKETIARVKNREYSELFSERELGISQLVNPDFEASMEIARLLRYPQAIKIEPFAGGKVDIVELKITENSPLNNVELRALSSVLKNKILVCAVERDGEVYIPSGTFTLLKDDKIFITADSKNVSDLFRELGMSRGARKVLIVGGSRLTSYLAQALEKSGISVKIIENDTAKCEMLSNSLDKSSIIQGDGTDQALLMEEGLLDVDAVVLLGGIDEQNIIVSMYAVSSGAKKVITKINNTSYIPLLENSGIDSVISAKTTTANEIVKCVRGYENSLGSSVNKLYKFVNENAEILEFRVTDSFKGLSIPLYMLGLKKNTLIAGIIRGGNLITPNGSDTIEEDDLVLIVTLSTRLDDLNDILE